MRTVVPVTVQVFQVGSRVGVVIEAQCEDLLLAAFICDTLRIKAEAKQLEKTLGVPVSYEAVNELWEEVEYEIQSQNLAEFAALRIYQLSPERGAEEGNKGLVADV
jgi:hypothetical protein